MSLWNRLLPLAFTIAAAGPVQGQSLGEKDLALILDRNPQQAIRFQNAGAAELFSPLWYQQIVNGFRATPVGDGVERENRFTDWQLVGVRVAPCMPLGTTPADRITEHCWPEVRLVWQPIVNFAPPTGLFADDRAIHAIYDVFTGDALNQFEMSRVITLRNRLMNYYHGGRNPANLLQPNEEAEFRALRNKVIDRMIGNTLWLRTLPNGYAGNGVRPEYFSAQVTEFRGRLLAWLQTYTAPHLIKEVTSFSLPAGRAPGQINVWSFIALSGQAGQLQQRSISIQSAVNGRTLANLGLHETVTRQQGDVRLLNAPLSPYVVQELRNSVIFNAIDRNRLLPRLADRQQILVANTSCASCHRFQQNGNDFHNMSYFTGSPQISLADRTQRDVALDLAWLATHQLRTLAIRSLEPES
ncbi:MAG: hypothetical protein M3Q07_27125 [Pseudobdellovibrionaceae bacterium]|nr:hypothetical protein [Pseudobdellovibrionaceae bacterium]